MMERDAPYRIPIPVFDEGIFNYETGLSDRYSLENFRDLLLQELIIIKNMEC
jgi:hypothetical protein